VQKEIKTLHANLNTSSLPVQLLTNTEYQVYLNVSGPCSSRKSKLNITTFWKVAKMS